MAVWFNFTRESEFLQYPDENPHPYQMEDDPENSVPNPNCGIEMRDDTIVECPYFMSLNYEEQQYLQELQQKIADESDAERNRKEEQDQKWSDYYAPNSPFEKWWEENIDDFEGDFSEYIVSKN